MHGLHFSEFRTAQVRSERRVFQSEHVRDRHAAPPYDTVDGDRQNAEDQSTERRVSAVSTSDSYSIFSRFDCRVGSPNVIFPVDAINCATQNASLSTKQHTQTVLEIATSDFWMLLEAPLIPNDIYILQYASSPDPKHSIHPPTLLRPHCSTWYILLTYIKNYHTHRPSKLPQWLNAIRLIRN
jgi:hypothetical protein